MRHGHEGHIDAPHCRPPGSAPRSRRAFSGGALRFLGDVGGQKGGGGRRRYQHHERRGWSSLSPPPKRARSTLSLTSRERGQARDLPADLRRLLAVFVLVLREQRAVVHRGWGRGARGAGGGGRCSLCCCVSSSLSASGRGAQSARASLCSGEAAGHPRAARAPRFARGARVREGAEKASLDQGPRRQRCVVSAGRREFES